MEFGESVPYNLGLSAARAGVVNADFNAGLSASAIKRHLNNFHAYIYIADHIHCASASSGDYANACCWTNHLNTGDHTRYHHALLDSDFSYHVNNADIVRAAGGRGDYHAGSGASATAHAHSIQRARTAKERTGA